MSIAVLVISAMRRLGNVQGFTLMFILDPCSKTCGGSDVQNWMFVCVGLLPINSTTCDSVCPGLNYEKKEHASFTTFKIC